MSRGGVGTTHRVRMLPAFTACLLGIAFLCPAQAPADHPLPTNPPTTKDILTPAAQRKMAPEFSRGNSDGRTFDLAGTRGKVVLLNFWATWCGGCKFELPYFVEYDKVYRSQGVVTLGISMDDEGFQKVKPFWAEKQMPYPTVIGNDTLAKQLGLSGMPFTLLIDRRGRVAIAHAGVLDRADFEHHIQQLLAEHV